MAKWKILGLYGVILLVFGAAIWLVGKGLRVGQIQTLDRRVFEQVIEVNLPELEKLDDPQMSELINHLRFSAAWRVFKEEKSNHPGYPGGLLRAVRRSNRYGFWLENDNVVYANGDNPPEVKVTLLFGRSTVNQVFPHTKPGYLQVAKASIPNVTLRAFHKAFSSDTGRPISHLLIEGNSILVDIEERSPSNTRQLTVEALGDIREILRSLSNSTLDRLQPDESLVIAALDSCTFVRTSRSGDLTAVHGYINPGTAGHIFVRPVILASGISAEWPYRITEQVGWSQNPNERFYFAFWMAGNQQINGSQHRYDLVFVPENGEDERVLTRCDPYWIDTYQAVSP